MEEYYHKKSGQVPAFGNWEYAKDMPITQYFESARQAGLVRDTCSSGECDPRSNAALYNLEAKKSSQKGRKGREKRHAQVKEAKKERRICDSTELPKKSRHHSIGHNQSDVVSYPRPQQRHTTKSHKPKAVDEDLYKIPPELLRTARKKKKLGFFSWCICAA